ncbi:UDP-GalNAc:beta-1,3-N-acetylgalactosaminyltransferase 2-like [Pollicipes pollicipes]|uniref:UDP-GalNAc:beta-1, 3-N-acetylgalactosaminyltransferase 2-like n=1 Tax=Pollicipes pollicipes TaxID=41117 RepID=UPI0018849FCB|nr:UDP-GalNAc:beta-1,3-N-acetylgalactosaminyltransferase 2-like [Pollicipes pollicipes]
MLATSGEQSLALQLGQALLPPAAGLAFTVLHPVVVRRVAAHLLPAGFEGVLRLEEPARLGRCRHSKSPVPGLLHVTALLTTDGRLVKLGHEPLCCPLRLVFTVHEPARLAELLEGRPASCHRDDGGAAQRALAEEAAEHGDLLLLPGVDVYRRLPDKLLGFFSWVSTHSSADWVIKCDDDVILDLPRILKNIPKRTGSDLWWGNFRYNWPANRYGKWAEYVYQAEVYPPFACGTASLLSMDAVRRLAASAQHLTRFQGEDTSLGIWLSGRSVRRVPDADWCG